MSGERNEFMNDEQLTEVYDRFRNDGTGTAMTVRDLIAECRRARTSEASLLAERDAVARERDGLRHSLEQMTISRDIAVEQRDRLESLLEAADQRLAALVGSLPRCRKCKDPATHEILNGGLLIGFGCDRHPNLEFGRRDVPWAEHVRSAPVGGARGEEK